ncbi:MAG TPA: MG2 domain-containing protein [Candidatus Brocadiia bacterium]|nr:MG2 domain-containing protein [Candidatus Brocadiia bacterium]
MKRRSVGAESLESSYIGALKERLVGIDPQTANEAVQNARESIELGLAAIDRNEVSESEMAHVLAGLGKPQQSATDVSQDGNDPARSLVPEAGASGINDNLPGTSATTGAWTTWKDIATTAILAFITTGGLAIAWSQGLFDRQPDVLKIVKSHPDGEAAVRDVSEIWIEFDAPLDPASITEDTLRLVPDAPGKTVMEGDRRLALKLARPLAKASVYRLTVSSKVRGKKGQCLDGKPLSFTTDPVAILDVGQTRIEDDGSAVVAVKFNQRVDPEELRERLSISDLSGHSLEGCITTGESSAIISLRLASTRWDYVRLTIKAGLVGAEGTIPLKEDYCSTVRIDSMLRFLGMSAEYGYAGESVVIVRMSSPVDIADAARFVTVEPTVAFTLDPGYSGMRILGQFEPGKRYKITLKSGLPAGAAGVLEKEVSRSVWFDDKPERIAFALGGGYLSPNGLLTVPVKTVNVKKAKLSIARLYESNIVEYALRADEFDYCHPEQLTGSLPESEIRISDRRNEEIETLLDLRKLVGGQPRGVYELALLRGDDYWSEERAVVVVTDLGISTRLSDGEAQAWVTSISSAMPVSGASVTIYSDTRQKIGTGTTGEDGVAVMPLRSLPPDEVAALVVVGRGEDLSYMKLSENMRPRGPGTALPRQYLASGYEVCAFTERGAYRPGDSVRFSAFIRGPGWATPPPLPVEVVVRKPDGRELVRRQIMSDLSGRIVDEIAAPQAAPCGFYQVSCNLPGGGESLGRTFFRIADYIPRALRMELDAPASILSASEPFTVAVRVERLCGGPASDLTVQCSTRYRSGDFRPEGWDGYAFGDARRESQSRRIDSDEERLDESGSARFILNAPSISSNAVITAEASVTVLEPGGRALVETVMRTLHSHAFYLGVRRQQEGLKSGDEGVFSLAAVAPSGAAFANARQFKASLFKITYSNVLKELSSGRLGYEWTRHETSVSACEGSFVNGLGEARIRLENAGSYRIAVESEGGCAVTHDFYVGGPDARLEMAEPEELQLGLDRAIYKPGEEATVTIQAPFDGMALICVESNRVIERRIISLHDCKGAARFTVRPEWRPNVYVTATLIRPVQAEEEWRPHRASGTARLDVDCADRRLDVEIRAPDHARPGREAEISVRAALSGTPLAGAAVVIAAVDEGVLSLTNHQSPSLWGFFYAPRRLGVVEYDMFSRLAPELAAWKVRKESEPGGDAPDEPESDLAGWLNPIHAQRVKTAVLYSASLLTDENGVASARFNVPQFVGELRIMAEVASGDCFGEAERSLPVRCPVMVNASWPRFLAPGDEFMLPVTVFNRTGGRAALNIGIETSDNIAPMKKPDAVELPTDGEETIFVPIKAIGVGKASASVTVSSGDENYSESVELPVRPAAAFARRGGGATVEPGEKRIFAIDGDFLPETARCSLIIAGTPMVNLSGAIHDLLDYPYGCVEQTTSRMLPLVYLRDVVEVCAPESIGREEIDGLFDKCLSRLMLSQTYSGGLTMWAGAGAEYPWGSLYALDALIEARKADFDVPEDFVERLLSYAASRMGEWVGRRDESGRLGMAGEAAYGCYVLARAGRPAYSWMAALEENMEAARGQAGGIPASAFFHLAAAHLIAGETESAKSFLARQSASCGGRQTWGYLDSPTRQDAVMLSVLLDVSPESDRIIELVGRLRKTLDEDAGLTTQENAFALMALGKYFRRMGPPGDASVSVTLPDGAERIFSSREGMRLDDLKPGQSVAVSVTGKGKAYARWRAEGVPASGEVDEKDSGISIRRRFFEADGETAADPEALKQGNIYIVELGVSSPEMRENIVVADLLPAGFEIEDPNLDGTSGDDAGEENWRIQHVERRDDRLLVFLRADAGRIVYRYTVRAVSPGRYALPAAEVSCMYDPSVFSVNGRGSVRVIR